ncbi:fumarate reductase/succinate dehydrogenase flavoprotein subunit [Gandjariella thermophila]|uniref:Fumarate reductase/succinate dehydrogenase flavoprotein-like FrdA n=1 Tax=Gandjariella thermophila TaxID=1931992 RepID=A0A4D4J1U7_9PSEU|nr:fumarate reductase/succinate dehydrogenase flavoprotein subunit [Gandjariella thermophila]GDY29062.1 fumarate reductase/succinate dehydrogenase flavoprotein-like FrdA [Gandjariella thermophila]
MFEAPAPAERLELACDVVVVGGGTAGTMAAITAAEHGSSVLLLEKAHVRHSGALAMGMDGVNNAVIPGKATPEDYVAEITRANDGVLNQRTVYQTASRGFDMVRRLERYGVKFEKDSYGEYAVRRVHRSGSYVLPMPEGKDVKKVLYRVLRQRAMRERIRIENRVMPVRVLTSGGRACGVAGFNTRTGEFVTVSAGAVILATGACGRLGLPASGYLYGTYENPTNAGDGHAMAYHAGAELSGIECYQINPLIKDYNGPACAYVANPFGGYQVNSLGERFVDCDYWSGQMMAEVAREIASARGPIYLKLTHLPEETISALEGILHTTERPTRGTFHANRGQDYRSRDVEMHLSEIGLCGGHSSSGVWVDEHARTTVPGLYAAGDLACVPHNYMIGAFVFGDLAGAHASGHIRDLSTVDLPEDQIEAAHELIYRPLSNPDGPPQQQVEYKLRRFVNDYIAPPKSATRLAIGLETFTRMSAEIAKMGGRTPHELMRCVEVSFIRDCAEMAARASLARTESRWGLYHERLDHPDRDNGAWFAHLNLRRRGDGAMEFLTRPVAPYLVPVDGFSPREGAGVRVLGTVSPPPELRRATGTNAHAAGDGGTTGDSGPARSPRIVELLALTEEQPALERLRPYLADPDPAVRRTAVATLTETTPAGFGPALADLLTDRDAGVRDAAARGLRELAGVLSGDDDLRRRLTAAATGDDPGVRATVVDLLRALGLGDRDVFTTALRDAAAPVRREGVRGLVSLNAAEDIATAAGDGSREVLVAAAAGLGTVGDPAAAPVLLGLAGDADPLVRAAALSAAAGLGCPPVLAERARAALAETHWQVRVGAAEALAGADPDVAVEPLLHAARDPHLDVRRAAVRSLARWAARPEVATALRAAVDDSDADVRAYARQALRDASPAS